MKTHPRVRITCAQVKSDAGLPEDSSIPTRIKSDGATDPEEEGRSPVGTPREENKSMPPHSVQKSSTREHVG